MSRDLDDGWEQAPVCFSCGRELGLDPTSVEYRGYGRREDGGPAWVASLCACQASGSTPGQACRCHEAARAFAAEDGAPLTHEEYRRWLQTA